ncbi:MAG TPA: YfhO family protein, partial [Flavobacterium sp.]|nr:YfhO family protein [Flavobacterium sp.]
STYLIVILGVGHNAKAHAIAYMPLVVAGVVLVFRRRFVMGGILTMLAAALEINANHFQMTYYLLILLLAIAVYFISKLIKEKDLKSLFYAFGVFAVAGILAIGANATNLMATAEYTDFSMRGKNELSFNPDGTPNKTTSSMDKEYITQYSYGIAESLNLFSPKLFGGSSSEPLDKKSNVVEFLQTQQIGEGQYISEDQAMEYASGGMIPVYWGDQPMVAAPAYVGAIVFFLCILALFNDNRKIKYAFLGGALVSLMLSWGKNFPALTNFFIDYVPFYDKFRAVSSIQVVLELCIPVLAIMGLHSFFKSEKDRQWNSLWKSAAVVLGTFIVLYVCKGLFSFSAISDDEIAKTMDPKFLVALRADRRSIYSDDLLRSGLFVAAAALILWLHIKDKLAQTTAVVLTGILMVSDLVLIDKQYLKNDRSFVSASEVDQPFQMTPADEEILKDTSVYRVYDIQGRLQGRTSYFHKAVGGYSAVRPRRFDQLFDYVIDNSLSDLGKSINPQTLSLTKNIPLLDALNVKYILVPTENGDIPINNPFTNGNAWFVNEVQSVQSADAEMKALKTTDLKNVAIVNEKDFSDVKAGTFAKDSTASIALKLYKSNHIEYATSNTNDGLAVFSEVYYPKGWNAYVDGKSTPIFRADYVLRAMKIPAGKHTVAFKFEPQVVKTGSTIALASSIGMVFLIVGGLYFERKKKWHEVKS